MSTPEEFGTATGTEVRDMAEKINQHREQTGEGPRATPVAFPAELRDIVFARQADLQREVRSQLNRMATKFGKTRDGFLFLSAVALSIAAVARDMANIPAYGGERRVLIPQPMVDGKPRADVIEELLIDQASAHILKHRSEDTGYSYAPPSKCNACNGLRRLGLPTATDDEVGADRLAEAPHEAPGVLVVHGDAGTLRMVLRGEKMPNGTPFAFFVGREYEALRMADRNELHEVLFG